MNNEASTLKDAELDRVAGGLWGGPSIFFYSAPHSGKQETKDPAMKPEEKGPYTRY